MEKPEPKHQAQFVPSGYLAFTRDMLTPDLLFSFGASQTWPIEGLNSSVNWRVGEQEGVELWDTAAQKGQAAWKEDVG